MTTRASLTTAEADASTAERRSDRAGAGRVLPNVVMALIIVFWGLGPPVTKLITAPPLTSVFVRLWARDPARVAALRSHLDLRERVAVVNAGQRRFMLPDQLIAWAETATTLPSLRIIVVTLALGFAAVTLVPGLTKAVDGIVKGFDTRMYPLVGAVLGYMFKK